MNKTGIVNKFKELFDSKYLFMEGKYKNGRKLIYNFKFKY